MKIIRISFDDESWQHLQAEADRKKISVQDHIRATMLPKKATTIFTVEEAESRALKRFEHGDEFSLPDLYSKEEWSEISRGEAGVFGRRFFSYIEKNPKIIFSRTVNRRARYTVIKERSDYNDE